MRVTTRDDSGAATILVIFCMVLLLGAVGISIDVARAVAVTRSAQNTADAVALAMGKDCVVRGGLAPAYNQYVRAGPAIGQGQSQSLTGGSCGAGFVTATAVETMNYSIAKILGMTETVQSRPATATWGQLASGVIFPFTFSECAFPDTFISGNSTTPGTPMMLYGQGVARTTCPRDDNTSGQVSNSKGFVAGGCQLTTIGGTLTDAVGNNFIGTKCDDEDLDSFVNKDVLLPVWGLAAGNPSQYAITSLVGFRVLGWSGNGNSAADRGGAMSERCTATNGFTGDPTTLGVGTKPCLYGYVTTYSSTTGGTTGAPCVSTGTQLQPACFVYLSK